MKILHTSDWHLGQSFLTKSRKEEHQAFLSWLLDQITIHAIDAIIVAGDIFDTGTPPSYARELYNQFIVSINRLNCTLVILGGNHDSVATLNESKELLACLNTHVIANTSDDLEAQLLTLKNSSGDVGAILCAVPFIRPRDVVLSTEGRSGQDKREALSEAICQHYHDIYQTALALRKQKKLTVPIIATGHLTALGVTPSESTRDIYIGTLDAFPAEGFPPADYIALGHIHRPQKVAKSDHIRYSGSPIPLSFDELKSPKQVVIAEFEQGKPAKIDTLDIPLFHPMATIKGDLKSIELQLNELSGDEEGVKRKPPFRKPTWLSIEVEVQDNYCDLQQRIQSLTEGLNVEVIQLKRARKQSQSVLAQEAKETLAELTPFDVFSKRLALESFEDKADEQRKERVKIKFKQLVSEVEFEAKKEVKTQESKI